MQTNMIFKCALCFFYSYNPPHTCCLLCSVAPCVVSLLYFVLFWDLGVTQSFLSLYNLITLACQAQHLCNELSAACPYNTTHSKKKTTLPSSLNTNTIHLELRLMAAGCLAKSEGMYE